MILLINACVRTDSRTKRLTDALLKELDGEITEVVLSEIDFPVVDEAFLQKRDALIAEKQWDDPIFNLAMQFKSADTIVVAAPYWDLSFPSSLKQYFEQINAMGTTFDYSDEGLPIPLCKAEKLYYVTTAGGDFFPEQSGFGYVQALAQNFYHIKDVKLIKATGLDIEGAPVEKILRDCEEKIRR